MDFDITTYGAVSDATTSGTGTDNSASIQAAIAAANSAYATNSIPQAVYFPPGRWGVAKGLYAMDGVSFSGEGKFVSTVVGLNTFVPNSDRPDGVNGYMCGLVMLDGNDITLKGVPLVGITIRGIGFDLNNCPNVWSGPNYTFNGIIGIMQDGIRPLQKFTARDIALELGFNTSYITENIGQLHMGIGLYCVGVGSTYPEPYDINIEDVWYHNGAGVIQFYTGYSPSCHGLTIRNVHGTVDKDFILDDRIVFGGSQTAGFGLNGVIVENCSLYIEEISGGYTASGANLCSVDVLGDMRNIHISHLWAHGALNGERGNIAGNPSDYAGAGNVLSIRYYSSASNLENFTCEDIYGEYMTQTFGIGGLQPVQINPNLTAKRIVGKQSRGPNVLEIAALPNVNTDSFAVVIEDVFADFTAEAYDYWAIGGITGTSAVLLSSTGTGLSGTIKLQNVQAGANSANAIVVNGTGWQIDAQGVSPPQGSTTLTGSGTYPVGTTSFTVANALVFQPQQYVQIDSETLLITAISGNTLTTPASVAAHATGAVVAPPYSSGLHGYFVAAGLIRIRESFYNKLTTWTQAAAASTTPLANPFLCDMAVCVSGSMVTAVAINGVVTGLTSGTFVLRAPSDTITLTYSPATPAPTLKWFPLG
jgi:hypothetical protein